MMDFTIEITGKRLLIIPVRDFIHCNESNDLCKLSRFRIWVV